MKKYKAIENVGEIQINTVYEGYKLIKASNVQGAIASIENGNTWIKFQNGIKDYTSIKDFKADFKKYYNIDL